MVDSWVFLQHLCLQPEITYYPVTLFITFLHLVIFFRKCFFWSCLLCYVRITTCTWIFLFVSWKWIYDEQLIWFSLNLLYKILSVENSKQGSPILREIANNISSSVWLYDLHTFSPFAKGSLPLPNNLIYYVHAHLWQAYTLKNCQISLDPRNICKCFSSTLRRKAARVTVPILASVVCSGSTQLWWRFWDLHVSHSVNAMQ